MPRRALRTRVHCLLPVSSHTAARTRPAATSLRREASTGGQGILETARRAPGSYDHPQLRALSQPSGHCAPMAQSSVSPAQSSVSPSRMEAFSDGVFSIAATLLVLEIALDPPGTALEQVLHAWPAYLGYVISFLTIGAAWLGHSAMTDRLTRADSLLLRINLLLLLVIAFLPFPTKLIARQSHDTDGERVFVTLYGLTLLTIRLLGSALDAYARREHLYSTRTSRRRAADRTTNSGAGRHQLRHRDPRRARPADTRSRAVLRPRRVPRRAVRDTRDGCSSAHSCRSAHGVLPSRPAVAAAGAGDARFRPFGVI